MRPNRVRQALAEGRVPLGHMIWEFSTRGIAKICEAAGLDFVLIDMEHSGFSLVQVTDLLAWFKATPVTPIVRVPASEYHFVARVMDAGAQGVMAPSVGSVEQARAVINAMRYAPEGGRGLGLGGALNDFVPPDPVAYMKEANRDNICVCQIESRPGLENLEAIAAAPGVDVLWVGHFDLSNALGIVGQFEHPEFITAIKRVADACQKHGKLAGVQPGDLKQARRWMDFGYNMISLGADSVFYRSALKANIDELRSAL
jgi:2-dehydro-3-deoxyglucarate aldolase/4-hydroxy-2-oxoheptanedioate aldolase